MKLLKAEVTPHDLARRSPPHAWEAYFLIGIFPQSSDLRFVKVHAFSGGRNRSRHCLSAIEGMDGEGEVLVLRGYRDRVAIDRTPGSLVASSAGWEVSAPGLSWRGEWPSLELSVGDLRARTVTRDVHWWVKIPRTLAYFTAFGELELEGHGKGVALVEHAWGGDVPFDPARLVPPRWQWDVLCFEDGGVCAGLEVGPMPLRSGGIFPGKRIESGSGLRVHVDAWTTRGDRKMPSRWRGSMRLESGEVRYEARAATDLAAVIPHGGFLGFEFEGSAAGRTVRGTGFCEYAAR